MQLGDAGLGETGEVLGRDVVRPGVVGDAADRPCPVGRPAVESAVLDRVVAGAGEQVAVGVLSLGDEVVGRAGEGGLLRLLGEDGEVRGAAGVQGEVGEDPPGHRVHRADERSGQGGGLVQQPTVDQGATDAVGEFGGGGAGEGRGDDLGGTQHGAVVGRVGEPVGEQFGEPVGLARAGGRPDDGPAGHARSPSTPVTSARSVYLADAAGRYPVSPAAARAALVSSVVLSGELPSGSASWSTSRLPRSVR